MLPFLLLFLSLTGAAAGPTAFSAVSAAGRTHRSPSPVPRTTFSTLSRPNPFSPRAALARYWSLKIPNNRPKPAFLLSKASPLSPADVSLYHRLASDPSSLAAKLPSFCSSANLFCPSHVSPHVSSNVAFSNYSSRENSPFDSFRSYNKNSAGQTESFAGYSRESNVATVNFTSYATGSTGGGGKFTAYATAVNVPALRFSNYATATVNRSLSFSSYSEQANAGDQSFSSYSKRASLSSSAFSLYANSSNVVSSSFSHYGEAATWANQSFSSYGADGNVPENSFSHYNGRDGAVKFSLYREKANVGDDRFSSYNKTSAFSHYGQSFNLGSDGFSGYGKRPLTFSVYGENSTFKGYQDKKMASFKAYNVSGPGQNSKWAEAGRFFREDSMKTGFEMELPDLHDKNPGRAFLPRPIAQLLPFSTARLDELLTAFNARRGSALAGVMAGTLEECERAPSRGETKKCVTSGEDMIDFATSVLGRDIVVRSTASPAGSSRPVKIGPVRAIDGGRETKAVSCHQSLFPYQVYYCHAVPRVRVYEAEIMDGPAKINDGVAICHLDTSDWSPGHGAFVALGDGPGKIEVCHWIYPGDMTWTVAE